MTDKEKEPSATPKPVEDDKTRFDIRLVLDNGNSIYMNTTGVKDAKEWFDDLNKMVFSPSPGSNGIVRVKGMADGVNWALRADRIIAIAITKADTIEPPDPEEKKREKERKELSHRLLVAQVKHWETLNKEEDWKEPWQRDD
jgi:hypothetical protein